MKIIDWHKGRIVWFKRKTGISDYGLLWYTFIKGVIIGAVIILLTGCGTAPAWLATSGGAYSEYKVITFSKTGLDLGLSANDLPTTNDFMLSKITGYDCKISRILDEKRLEAICEEIKVFPPEETNIDKNEKK